MKTKMDIKKIKDQLPHGALTEIAILSNVSLQTVSGVINGKSQNRKVLKAITKYLTDLNSEKEVLLSFID
jgi:hypothetical protein